MTLLMYLSCGRIRAMQVTTSVTASGGSKRKKSTTAPSGVFAHSFKFQGKTYRLLKRKQTVAASWHFMSTIAGHRFGNSLDTNVALIAQKRAIKKYIEPAWGGRWGEAKTSAILTANTVTVGTLLDHWERLVSERSAEHVRQVGLNFLAILRRAGYPVPQRERLSTVVNRPTVDKWRAAVLVECEELDQEESSRRKRSQNSIFTSAKSLFSAPAMGDFRAAGLDIPDPTEFIRAFKERKFRRVAKEDAPMDRAGMRAMIHGLLAVEDDNLRGAVLLALAFGLRKGEVAQVAWRGIAARDGGWWLNMKADVKRGSGRLVVRGVDPWCRLLLREQPEGYLGSVLRGPATEREENVFRRIGEWLRDEGWEGQKTTHSLRAFAGGEMALKYGLYQCQAWLRHKSITTTENHYTRQWMEQAAAVPRIRWARAYEEKKRSR